MSASKRTGAAVQLPWYVLAGMTVPARSAQTASRRKQWAAWSLTMPTACIQA